ncbi:(Fe-S)-binding protein [Chloroflexota bacterium]
MSLTNLIVFIVVLIITAIFAGRLAYKRFSLIGLGRPENRFDHKLKRFWNMLFLAIGQRRVATKAYSFGANHVFLHFLFWIVSILYIEFILSGLFPRWVNIDLLPDTAYSVLSLIFELALLLVLICIVTAMIRRIFFRPSYIDKVNPDAGNTLTLLFFMMVGYFLSHGGLVAAGVEPGSYKPVASAIAGIFPAESGQVYATAFWWVGVVALLGFMTYLFYTKHMHILTAIPNCFLKSLTKVNTQEREEFKKGNTYGVEQVDQFKWKALFDSYSCTDCGRCSDNCPATNTDKPLNPRYVIRDIKYNLIKNGKLLAKKEKPVMPLIGGGKDGSIDEEVLWECTTCGTCMEVCPVFIEHVPRIVDLRRNLVEMHARFPEELIAFFENIEQRSNPWGIAPSDRVKWAADLDVKPYEGDNTEYLFYVGCAGAFDARNRKTTVAITQILDKAGISWGILGKEEMCCGDSLRRLGNEYVFNEIVTNNLKLFNDKGIKRIITQCPHCFSTLKNDYRQFGGQFEVIHHTELINDLIKSGKLALKQTDGMGNVVFHDSCYLGRYNAIYEAPREAVKSATGQKPAEMDLSRNRGFCCGAGGGRMWMEEVKGKRIYVERVEHALSKNPDTVCVCCPYCMTMFEDGLKDKSASKVQVLDLAEIIAKAIK